MGARRRSPSALLSLPTHLARGAQASRPPAPPRAARRAPAPRAPDPAGAAFARRAPPRRAPSPAMAPSVAYYYDEEIGEGGGESQAKARLTARPDRAGAAPAGVRGRPPVARPLGARAWRRFGRRPARAAAPRARGAARGRRALVPFAEALAARGRGRSAITTLVRPSRAAGGGRNGDAGDAAPAPAFGAATEGERGRAARRRPSRSPAARSSPTRAREGVVGTAAHPRAAPRGAHPLPAHHHPHHPLPLPSLATYNYGGGNPMRPHRVRLTHSLVEHYGLPANLAVHRPVPRSELQLEEFHADDYIRFLKAVTPDNQDEFLVQMRRFNLGPVGEADCPVFDSMFEYCSVRGMGEERRGEGGGGRGRETGRRRRSLLPLLL